MKKLNIIKIIHSDQPEEKGWSRKEVAKDWMTASLYYVENRELIQIQYKGKHINYLMKRGGKGK